MASSGHFSKCYELIGKRPLLAVTADHRHSKSYNVKEMGNFISPDITILNKRHIFVLD